MSRLFIPVALQHRRQLWRPTMAHMLIELPNGLLSKAYDAFDKHNLRTTP